MLVIRGAAAPATADPMFEKAVRATPFRLPPCHGKWRPECLEGRPRAASHIEDLLTVRFDSRRSDGPIQRLAA